MQCEIQSDDGQLAINANIADGGIRQRTRADDKSERDYWLNERTPRKVVSLDGFRFAGAMGAWLSLTLNDEPLILRDVGGGTEIYALHWDAR